MGTLAKILVEHSIVKEDEISGYFTHEDFSGSGVEGKGQESSDDHCVSS